MRLDELELPEVDVYSNEYLDDPHALTSELRKENWVVKYNHGYMLLDLESMKYFLKSQDCRTANRDVTKLVGADPSSSFARFNDHFMQALEGEEHKNMRNAINRPLGPKAMNIHRPLMRETIHTAIDAYASSGECDFADFARHYPITVMCSLLGIDASYIPKFEAWLESMASVTAPTPENMAAVDDALKNMFIYAESLVEERRQPENRKEDLLQQVVDLGDDNAQLSEEEIRILIVHLLAGGYDTSKNHLILMMKAMLDFPEQLDIIEKDRSKIKPFIEESLRYQNPIGILNRMTNIDIEYRDVTFPKETMLFMPVTVAGRDAAANETPDKFDIDREKKNHCAWGQGHHICPGMFMAKAILEEGMDVILDRMKKMRPAGEAKLRPYGPVWGYATLPMTFNPVART